MCVHIHTQYYICTYTHTLIWKLTSSMYWYVRVYWKWGFICSSPHLFDNYDTCIMISSTLNCKLEIKIRGDSSVNEDMWQELGMYVYQPGAIQIQQNNRILQQNLGRTNTQRTNGVSIRNIRLKRSECKPQNLEDVHRYLFQVTELQQNNTECCDSPSTKNSSQEKWGIWPKNRATLHLGFWSQLLSRFCEKFMVIMSL